MITMRLYVAICRPWTKTTRLEERLKRNANIRTDRNFGNDRRREMKKINSLASVGLMKLWRRYEAAQAPLVSTD